MRLDRLLRRLAPFTGLLTVAGTCGDVPDCKESGATLSATVSAEGVLTANLDSSSDGTIAAPEWKCTGSIFAQTRRPSADVTPVRFLALLTADCTFTDGTSTRNYYFDVPIGDPRALSTEETVVSLSFNASTYSPALLPGRCNGVVPARLRITSTRSVGESAPPPAHVTSDFVREVSFELSVDDRSEPENGGTGCRFDLLGMLKLDAALSRSSFSERAANTCL